MFSAVKSFGSVGFVRPRSTARAGLTATLLAMLAFCGAPLAAETDALSDRAATISAQKGLQHRWTGPDDQPLPFQTDEEILDFLASAQVIKSKVLSSGSTKPLKVLLEKDGVRANAVFRSVDLSTGKGRDEFRDSFLFEIAAYETARLLGLNNVPPVTLRSLDNRRGSIQLWVENARSETDRIAEKETHRSASKVLFQKHSMRVFDQLIYNFDRNTGNILVDNRDRLWMIDHTRSFKPRLELPNTKAIFCDRALWQRLKGLDTKKLQKRLRPHLSPLQIGALLKRHEKLVAHIEELIRQNGEDSILFDSV